MSLADDLFGHVPQRGELFSEPMEVTPPIQHTPETIRALMLEILGEARAAEAMPWTARLIRSHTAMFPYMAEWLDERSSRAELARDVGFGGVSAKLDQALGELQVAMSIASRIEDSAAGRTIVSKIMSAQRLIRRVQTKS